MCGSGMPWTSERTGILVRLAGVAQWSDRLPADRKHAVLACVDRLAVRERNGSPDVAGVAAGWPCLLSNIGRPLTRPAGRYAGPSARRRPARYSSSTLPLTSVGKSGSNSGKQREPSESGALFTDYSRLANRASAPMSGAGCTASARLLADGVTNDVPRTQGRASIQAPGRRGLYQAVGLWP